MKILLFDYDGVIVDSISEIITAFNKIGKKYGLPKTKNKEDFEWVHEKNVYEVLKEFGMSKLKITLLIAELKIHMLKHQKNILMFKDMKNALNQLAKTNQLIIITSNVTKVVKKYLEDNQINVFTEVLGGDIEKSKVKKIISMKNKYPDSDLYYIGDTNGDIKEGNEAKVKTVAVTWGYQTKEKLMKHNPDFVVDAPKELLELLK